MVEYNKRIDNAKNDRKQTRGVDPVLLAEYGYVLALANIYDVALITLDEAMCNAKMLPQKDVVKEVNYYVSEVLFLMRYDNLAMPFQRDNVPPKWISNQDVLNLRNIHTTAPIVSREDFKTTFARINKLAAEQSLIQALVLSEELSFFYDKQFVSKMIMGDIWEQLGFFEEALQCYQNVRDKSEENDSLLLHSSEQRIQHVQKKICNPFARFKLKYNPRMMLYLGGVFSLSSTSVNARVGVYTNTQFSASLNFAYTHLYEETGNSFYIGLSAYKRFFNILAVGIGFNQQFGNGDYTFFIAPSVGASIYILRKKISLDVFYNMNIPCKSGMEVQNNLSFGVTTYL